MKYLLLSFLLASSAAQSQRIAPVIYQADEVQVDGTVKRELWYADTMRSPFSADVYEELLVDGRVQSKKLMSSGQAVLAGEPEFIITPSSESRINAGFSDRAELITRLGFKAVKAGRWIVRTGTWGIADGTNEKHQYTAAAPFILELDKLIDLQEDTEHSAVPQVTITSRVLDSGIRIYEH
jgi:hypothetical protein